jgi:hypothetical protein
MKDITFRNTMQEKNDKTLQKCFSAGAAMRAAYHRVRCYGIWLSTASGKAIF